ncbi:MAG: hypothetical protein HKN76_19325, partial [Saprospiraceae bacterium]|nr:hypothetical protein [Saprospiraceae bacterium]
MNGVIRGTLKILLIISFLAPARYVCSQSNVIFKTLDRSAGLSQNTVFATIQDRDGFIWFGTRDGLNKYDGYQFRVFRSSGDVVGELADDDIRTLMYDSTLNVIWIGTPRGLSKYRIESNRFETYNSIYEQCHEEIRFCKQDESGNFFVGSGNCLWQYNEIQDTFISIDLQGINKEGQRPELTDFVQIAEDTYCIGTRGGLFVGYLHGNTMDCSPVGNEYPQLAELDNRAITITQVDREGNLWIGSSNDGLFICSAKFQVLDHHSLNEGIQSRSANRVQAIAFGNNGEAWIGTGDRLSQFDTKAKEVHPQRLSGQDEKVSVRSLLIDRKGSLWAGTYFAGVKYLDADWGQFSHFRPGSSGSINHKVIGSMVEDKNGQLWIATEGGGIHYFDPHKGRVLKIIKDELSGSNIKSLLLDGSDLWAGTYQRGLNRYDLENDVSEIFQFDLQDPGSLPHDNVYDLQIYLDDLWIATYGGGLAKLNRETAEITRLQHHSGDTNSLCNNLVRALYLDGNNGLLVGTDKGLDRLKVKNGEYHFDHVVKDIKVLSIFRDAKGTLWIGTRATGLHKLVEKNRVFIYDNRNGLAGKSVFGIMEDASGYLWVSTDQGIARFDPGAETFMGFSDAEELQNLEFNFNSYIKTEAGEMYFGSTNGFVRFYPERIKNSNYLPPLVFT